MKITVTFGKKCFWPCKYHLKFHKDHVAYFECSKCKTRQADKSELHPETKVRFNWLFWETDTVKMSPKKKPFKGIVSLDPSS